MTKPLFQKTDIKDYKTFDAWSKMGLRIKKGEKAERRDPNGTPLFHKDQVWDPDACDTFVDFDGDLDEDDPFNDPYLFC